MDVTNEQTIDISIGSATELRDLNISRSEAMQNLWRSADKRFKTVFEANPFGLSWSVCDRLLFESDLKKVKHRNISFLQTKFPDENITEFRLCSTCSKSIDANKIPTLSRSNGIADDKMIGYNTLMEIATARRNLHKMSVVESGGLPYSLKLAFGYPYMITMNLDVEDGLVNGAIGTLKNISLKTNR
ncbi:uncharacterized protein TNCV_1524601 [Trichonephila clavipes]|nr:uncharacterized protein TNCV_1524601 [Trichonephila clavipes]